MHTAQTAPHTPQGVPFVPDARAPLSDAIVSHTRNLWQRAVSSAPGEGPGLTEAEVDLLALSIGPLLEELVQRRAAMSIIETACRPGTVVAFERVQG